jgi:DNA topoisomerase-2
LERNLTIPEQIDQDYRRYALYVIQSRGIPNFYDGLTPVQRIILQMAPNTFDKTLGVVGSVFSTGLYNHGDASLASAICKLARPFGCSDQILLGDGFFGTPVNPTPSSPRYTRVKVSPRFREIFEKHIDLNPTNEEGGLDWLHVELPIGLATHVVGIAVGYRSNILPRRLDEVEAYLNGDKSKKLKPYFRGFKGKITRVDGLRSSWLIEGNFEADADSKTITIDGLSPLQRYDSFINKLNIYLDSRGFIYKMSNTTTDEVRMTIKFRCTAEEFKDIAKQIRKDTQQIVTENIVIVKDGSVTEYDSLEQYLDEFSIHRELVLLRRISKDLGYSNWDLSFLEAKLKFLIFMSEKKRTNIEIVDFLSQFETKIKSKLESISLIRLNKEEMSKTREDIQNKKEDISRIKKEEKAQEKKYNDILKEWNKKGGHKIKRSSLLLESPSDEYFNGVKIWNPEEDLVEPISESSENLEESVETNK